MNYRPLLTTLIALSTFFWFSCEDKSKEKDEIPDWGRLDFSRFVSLGNSITAGVSDGALYELAQQFSFPKLIAKKAGIESDFEQPVMAGNGFSWNEKDGRMFIDFLDFSIGFWGSGSEANRDLDRPYNNLGIPLLTAEQFYTATTTLEADSNHFVDKILRNSGRTPIEEALSLDPTIITLWVGNNDILGAASLGLASQEIVYTDASEFSLHLDKIVTQLTASTNAPIFIANVFDMTTLPYFASLPSFLTDTTTSTKFYLYGYCEDGIRQLTDDDLVLFWALPQFFTIQDSLNHGIEPTAEMAFNDTLILDASEKAEIQQLISDYNDIIRTTAETNDQIYHVDIYELFQTISISGYKLNGTVFTSDLITFDETGSMNLNATQCLFSFDGLHPNRYGYAAIANTFIEAMNDAFEADIPFVKITDLY